MPDSDFPERLVGSPCCLPGVAEAELFPIYEKLGLRKFEGFSEWAACRHDWTSDPEAARARARARSLRFTSYHLPAIGDDTETGFAAALSAARFAAGIGAGLVLFKARRLELFEAVGRRFLDALEEEKIPVVPVLQNHAGSAISTLDDYRNALAAFGGDPRIRGILEVGHFRRIGVDWRPGWDLLGE
ncbi:MAG TPA: hypothetical protein VGP93_00840, partial [Polyangiaceae bacterium]|nr:hypothetical protein [Polyangiaceae bacterium]